MSFLNQ